MQLTIAKSDVVNLHLPLDTKSCKCNTSMPYSEEDAIIIQNYRQTYNWGSRKVLSQLGSDEDWTRDGIEYIIKKVDETGSHNRRKGSWRPTSVRTVENKE